MTTTQNIRCFHGSKMAFISSFIFLSLGAMESLTVHGEFRIRYPFQRKLQWLGLAKKSIRELCSYKNENIYEFLFWTVSELMDHLVRLGSICPSKVIDCKPSQNCLLGVMHLHLTQF